MDRLRRNHQDTKDTKDTKKTKVSAPDRRLEPAQGPAANVAREHPGPGRFLYHFLVSLVSLVSWWFRLYVPRLFAPIISVCLAIILLAGCTGGSGGTGDKVKLVITPVETPTGTPLAAPTMAPTSYAVKSGDTLSGIAALFGVSVDDIVRANNIADPNRLSEGQVLTIPVRPSGSPTEGNATPKAGTPNPSASPALPPPNVTPPLGPPVTDQPPGGASSPGSAISPTAIP